VAWGRYQEGDVINIPIGIHLYGGFAGTETELEQRDSDTSPTIIDGENSYQCVKNYGTIDGFHITNGKANYGGGIHNYGIVNNCCIYSNYSSLLGGGIYNYSAVVNCTIYSNTARFTGGGIYNYTQPAVKIKVFNCISWNNKNGDMDRRFEDIYFSCFGEAREKNGNIRGNPLFANTSGDPSTWDFHLQNGSPCIDSGTLEDTPESDIEGNPRPGGDGKVCMGAYESPNYYTPSPPLSTTRIYVSKNGDDTTGKSWQNAYTSINSAINSLNDNLYEIWVAHGIYRERDTVSVSGRMCIYGSFAGTETELEQRDLSTTPTIIDGEKSYGCVKNYGTFDGFHITNGETFDYGGGILNAFILENCHIYSNRAQLYAGGIYNCEGFVNNCFIHSNSGGNGGGGILNVYGTVIGSSVYSNSVYGDGGGIWNIGGIITDCIIYSNHALSGGGTYNSIGGIIQNSSVYMNTCKFDGGGIDNNNSTISGCSIYSNSANRSGGGVENTGTIKNCYVCFNSSIDHSGGVYNRSSGKIYNSILYNNSSPENIGGMRNYGILFNVTLYNNTGGIENLETGKVINCISWQNGNYDISGDGIVEHSCFKEATGRNGNINQNPLFENISGNISTWDFRLRDGSPCIDAGVPDETNYDACSPPGKHTLINDMGAYGGPYNCWGEFFMSKQDLIDHLLGRKELSNDRLDLADKNTDTIIDIADVVQFMLLYCYEAQ